MSIANATMPDDPASCLPALAILAAECLKALVFLLVPFECLYFAVYFRLRSRDRIFKALTALCLLALWLAPWITPIHCAVANSLQRFAVSIGSMKALDLLARRHALPTYAAGAKPPGWLLALLLVTELRYESFAPNHIRADADAAFHEPSQLALHVAAFAALQTLPQTWPLIIAYEVLLAVYILWTSMQLVLRYDNSPALFGPLYLADSVGGFWSTTWHNAFAAPCHSLAYAPIRSGLPRLGVSGPAARSLGVLGAFGLMAAFHVYALSPIISAEGVFRVAVFFVVNGVATIAEAAVWGRHGHWTKALLAWGFESALAAWTVGGLDIPQGLWTVDWREFC